MPTLLKELKEREILSVEVDRNAIVSPDAHLDEGVRVGPYAIIEGDTVIGSRTVIGPHAVIASGTRIGPECRIFSGAVVGSIPQDLKFNGEYTTLEVGERTTIREYATLNRGTMVRGKTTVGDDCLIMSYVHIAHDCDIRNHVILSNAVNMAGHVTVDDYSTIGGVVAIHQFVNIGCHTFIGGGYRVPKDVPPYILATDEPLTYGGVNTVGLKRRGFSAEARARIKQAYKLLYRSNLNVSQAVERMKAELEDSEEIRNIVSFVTSSERGIV